jgi:4-aminobutyrate aminotransferase
MRQGQPDKEVTKAIQKGCIERRLLLLTCGSYENVIRWIPPLVVNEAQIDAALTVFEAAVQAAL